jgi:CBS domain-containing protein
MKSIREVLSGGPVVALTAKATALEAARRMVEGAVGALLVVDGRSAPIGIFTERDLMQRVVVPGRDPAKVELQEVMTRNLFVATPDEPVTDVARTMQERHIRHLPVVEHGRVIGMLSLRDLLRAHLSEEHAEVEVLRAYIQGEEGRPASF